MFEKYFNLTAKAFVKFCKNILICQQKLFVKMFNKYFNLNLRRYWNIGQPLTPSIPPSLLKHSFKQMFPGFFTALKSQKLDLCCSQSNNRLLIFASQNWINANMSLKTPARYVNTKSAFKVIPS